MFEELGGDGCSHGKGMALSERAGSILDATQDISFGMARCYAAPLAEALEVFHAELTGQGKGGIQHRGHMPGV